MKDGCIYYWGDDPLETAIWAQNELNKANCRRWFGLNSIEQNNMSKLTKEEALAKIEELKKYVEQEEASDGFEYGDDYYVITDTGNVLCSTWENDRIDDFRLDSGNAYKTEGLAEAALAKQKAINKINKWIRENGAEADKESGVAYVIDSGCEVDSWTYESVNVNFPRILPISERSHAERCLAANRAEYELLFKGE